VLEIRGLNVAYGRVQVLYDVDLTVGEGELVALLGTNGAGKTTILKAACGLVPVMSGDIRFDGHDLRKLDAHDLVGLGLVQVPGGRGVFPGLTVLENLRIGGYRWRKDGKRLAAEVDRVVGAFPWLAERSSQMAGSLSGGQQQMLNLARAFIACPRMLLVDELSLGLAPRITRQLLDMLDRARQDGVTIVIVEQNASMALEATEHAYFLERGRIRFDGASKELLERPDLLRSVFIGSS